MKQFPLLVFFFLAQFCATAQWYSIESITFESLEAIHFFDDSRGIYSGAFSKLLISYDSGTS